MPLAARFDKNEIDAFKDKHKPKPVTLGDAFGDIGEGEYPVLELMEAIDNGKDDSAIKNLWIKKQDGIIKNPLRNLICDLDSSSVASVKTLTINGTNAAPSATGATSI